MGHKPQKKITCPGCGSDQIDHIGTYSAMALHGCRVCLTGFMIDGDTIRVLPRPGSQPN